MDPVDIPAVVENQSDVLSPEARDLQELFKTCECELYKGTVP
jgi:hypothetical protein